MEKESDEIFQVINKYSAYLFNKVMMDLYPTIIPGRVGVKENGFYSDIDMQNKILSANDLGIINDTIKKIINKGEKPIIFKVSKEEAFNIFKDNVYKREMIASTEGDSINIIEIDNYKDIVDVDSINIDFSNIYLELFAVSSAYWNNDASNKSLIRVSGIAFDSKDKIEEYKKNLEEAKQRDHRKIGKELELFMFDDAAQGMPFWLPNGTLLYDKLVEFWKKIHKKNGYQEIKTPMIMSEELWHRSGHWDHYKENMYTTQVGDVSYALKPMNCPGCMLVYKNKPHSYKELPLRYGELGQVHRHEASGTLNGLFRVRTFTQDDAHILCMPNQIESEIKNLLNLIDEVYKLFGFKYTVELSTRPDNSMGSDEVWNLAENSLKKALIANGVKFNINEGDGAFYGPKIDFHLKDCLGRDWQCGTIQLDFQMPERFDLTYIGDDGKQYRPVMLHRVILGSIERFLGILTEQYKGAYPMWLSPTQINIIPVNNEKRLVEYANYINEELLDDEIRTTMDCRNEKVGFKIRESMVKKIPMTFIIGGKEVDSETISYRQYGDNCMYTDGKDDVLKLVKMRSSNPADAFKRK